MEQLTLPARTVPDELKRWVEQNGGRPLLAAIELDDEGRLVLQPLPDVDPLAIPRVLKSMTQYQEVLRRLA